MIRFSFAKHCRRRKFSFRHFHMAYIGIAILWVYQKKCRPDRTIASRSFYKTIEMLRSLRVDCELREMAKSCFLLPAGRSLLQQFKYKFMFCFSNSYSINVFLFPSPLRTKCLALPLKTRFGYVMQFHFIHPCRSSVYHTIILVSYPSLSPGSTHSMTC